jgi:hypothetical protein
MQVTLDLNKLKGDLVRVRAGIEEFERERQRKYQEMNDLAALIDLIERMYASSESATENVPEDAPVVEVNGQPVAQDLAAMDTKTAFTYVLKQSGKAWALRDLAEEMLRRGWNTRDPADNPFSAVNTAAGRLVKADPHIVRPRYGWYEWREEPFPVAQELVLPSNHYSRTVMEQA